jgi:hypothetical protein
MHLICALASRFASTISRKKAHKRDTAVFQLAAIYFVLTCVSHVSKFLLGGICLTLSSFYFEEDQDVFITRESIVCQITGLLGKQRRNVFTSPATDVRVHTEILRMFGKGHNVVITLENGCEVPLSTSCTMGSTT